MATKKSAHYKQPSQLIIVNDWRWLQPFPRYVVFFIHLPARLRFDPLRSFQADENCTNHVFSKAIRTYPLKRNGWLVNPNITYRRRVEEPCTGEYDWPKSATPYWPTYECNVNDLWATLILGLLWISEGSRTFLILPCGKHVPKDSRCKWNYVPFLSRFL